jgi:hypothetical protein
LYYNNSQKNAQILPKTIEMKEKSPQSNRIFMQTVQVKREKEAKKGTEKEKERG